MPTSDEAHELIEFEPEYVYSRRHGDSLTRLLERYPDGCPNHIAAQVLLMTEEEVEQIYDGAVAKLRDFMRV